MQNQKNKYLAALLAYTFGGFGAHRFYLGQTGRGLLYLLFFWTLIPAIVAFFETFYFLMISDDEFNRRYNSGHLLPPGRSPKALPAPQPAYAHAGQRTSANVRPQYAGNSAFSTAYDSPVLPPQGADGSIASPASNQYAPSQYTGRFEYAASQPADITDIRASLEDLERLHREGRISQDEYLREKDRLWNRLAALSR